MLKMDALTLGRNYIFELDCSKNLELVLSVTERQTDVRTFMIVEQLGVKNIEVPNTET